MPTLAQVTNLRYRRGRCATGYDIAPPEAGDKPPRYVQGT